MNIATLGRPLNRSDFYPNDRAIALTRREELVKTVRSVTTESDLVRAVNRFIAHTRQSVSPAGR